MVTWVGDCFVFLLILCISIPFRVLLADQPNTNQDLSYLSFVYKATEFSSSNEYDYIVVGGGTAGCPLAATLSSNYSVLLLERGVDAHNDSNVMNESGFINNILQADNKESPAQAFTSEDGIPNVRGRVLGGSSMINAGFYSRADHDFYAESGIKWDMEQVHKSYEWVEETIVTRSETLNSWQSSVKNALLESGIGPDNGFSLDHKDGTKISGSIFDRIGRRHGAVELLNKANPTKLQVVVRAMVERVIFSSKKSSGLYAIGVIYRDSTGKSHFVRLREKGEIILSAGALGSPQLLLLSGVGPKTYLKSLKIPTIHNQPFIGQYMSDNPRNQISITPPFPLADIGLRVVGITRNGSYIESTSGIASFSTPITPIFFPYRHSPLNLTVLAIVEKLSRTLSTGSLHLASPTDVHLNPIVRFNYFANPIDLAQCVIAMRNIGNMMRTPTMEKYMFWDPINEKKYFQYLGSPMPENQSDDRAMEIYCRKTLATIWHYHGGCVVKKVVDNEFNVIGIKSLRIVDGSTFLVSPGTNPQATLMMLGRYVGLKIQEGRKPNNKGS